MYTLRRAAREPFRRHQRDHRDDDGDADQPERGGIAVPLVIGNKGYGKYRWSVLDHKMKMKTYDGRGNVTSATVSVSLQEYLRG